MNKVHTLRSLWMGWLFVGSIFALRAQIPDLSYPKDTIQDTVVYRYSADKSIGLYRISKNFGVPQAEILRWNPQLRERGPQLGEVLLIPAGIVQHTAEPVPVPVQPKDTQVVVVLPTEPNIEVEMPKDSPIVSVQPYDTQTVWRLSVMLPINARLAERNEDDDCFYDFYTGLLTAVYEAQQAGVRMEIHTYDVPRTDKQLSRLLDADSWLATAHAIVGPAYAGQVNTVAQWAKAHRIRMMVPFSSKVNGIETNPYLYRFNTTTAQEAACVADTMVQYQDRLHCVWVKADGKNSSNSLVSELTERQIRVDTLPLHDLLVDSAEYALSDSLPNLLILHTDNYANAGVLIPHIKQLAIRRPLSLYTQYAWLKNSEIQPLKKTYSYVFNDSDTLSSRRLRYEELHNRYFAPQSQYQPAADHPRYDLLGYDLTTYLLHYILPARADDTLRALPVYEGLQSTMRFERTQTEGGWVNTFIQSVYEHE